MVLGPDVAALGHRRLWAPWAGRDPRPFWLGCPRLGDSSPAWAGSEFASCSKARADACVTEVFGGKKTNNQPFSSPALLKVTLRVMV